MSHLHISISAEPIFHIGNFEITNSMVISLLVTLLLISMAINAQKHFHKKQPPKWVVFFVLIIEAFYEFVSSIAPVHARKFFPIVASIFLFVLFGNWAVGINFRVFKNHVVCFPAIWQYFCR